MTLEPLFQKVRAACSPQLWSKAVEIARKELVSGLGTNPQEILLRVSQSTGGLSSEVTLTLEDLDWLCSCGSDDDPCFHVAAAVIALKRAQEKGENLPVSAQVGGRITYEWIEVPGRFGDFSSEGASPVALNLPAPKSSMSELRLRRQVVYPDGRVSPLTTKIAAMVAGRVPNPGISATPDDVEIDLQLIQMPQMVFVESSSVKGVPGDLLSGAPPYPTVTQQKALIALLKALQKIDSVSLQGSKVAVSPQPVSLEVIVADEGAGVRLSARQDPDIQRNYTNFLARCRSTVRPWWIPSMNLQLRDLLKSGKFYGPRDFPELVSEVLPPLKEVLPVVVRTHKLPGVTYGEPFLDLVITRDPTDSQTLISELKIFYKTSSDGVVAVIENGRLVPLKPQVPVPSRDSSKELALKDQASRKFGREIGQKQYHRGQEAIALMKTNPTVEPRLLDSEQDCLSDFRLYGTLGPQIDVHDRGLSLAFMTGVSASGDSTQNSTNQGRLVIGAARRSADPYDVLTAFHRGESLVPLIGGGWGEIPRAWLAQYAGQLQAFLTQKQLVAAKKEAKGHEKSASTQAAASPVVTLHLPAGAADGDEGLSLLADLGSFVAALGGNPSEAMSRAQTEIATLLSPPPRPLPGDLRATLRPYQLEGYHWLTQIRHLQLGALLCDEMGLGKTLQSIAAMEGQTLIIAPASVMPNWSEEIRKFRPEVSVHVYHGPGRSLNETIKNQMSVARESVARESVTRRKRSEGKPPEVTLTTYGTLRTDLNKLSGFLWDTIIVDEGQTIKNPHSQISQAVHGIRGRFRILLTGTPVENRLEDLWSQMHFANPQLLGSLEEFRKTFSLQLRRSVQDQGASGSSVPSGVSRELWAQLHGRMKPYLKRRLKTDVAPDLPEKTETIRYVELTPQERSRYEALRLATREDLLAKMGIAQQAMLALEGLLRLRQAACHGRLLPGFGVESDGSLPYANSSKLAVLVELLQESIENGHKILVFSQWTSFLKLISTALDFHQISYGVLTGETDTKDRMDVVQRFQDPAGPKTLLLSLKAGGVGLNLTAADHVIFVDPWWNPAVEDQAIDRAHRIGQNKPILVQRLVALQTVEERILALKEHKKKMASAALGAHGPGEAEEMEQLRQGLSSEEILDLLN